MNPLYILLGGIFAAVWLFWPNREKKEIQRRLNQLSSEEKQPQSAAEQELQKSFKERIILPLLHSFSRKSKKKTDKAQKEKLKQMLGQAGNPWGLNVDEFVALRTVLTFSLLFVFELICFIARLPVIHFVMAGMMAMIMSILVPNFYLKNKIAWRQKMVERKLPDVLDLLTVSVEAGLGFDSAMSKVVEKFEGPLADEFTLVLNEVKLGKKRKDSLRDMANKMEVEDLSNFISSLIQAEQLGVSLGNVLRIQSAQARQRRRQRAEEAAMKAPVKMLLPLVGCVFPTIFIIIFTPIVIRVYDVAVRKK